MIKIWFIDLPSLLKKKDIGRQTKRFWIGNGLGVLAFFPTFYGLKAILGNSSYLVATFLAYVIDYGVKFFLHKFWASKDKSIDNVKGPAFCYFLLCVINTALTYYNVEYRQLDFWETQKAMILPTSILSLSLLFVWAKMFKH